MEEATTSEVARMSLGRPGASSWLVTNRPHHIIFLSRSTNLSFGNLGPKVTIAEDWWSLASCNKVSLLRITMH